MDDLRTILDKLEGVKLSFVYEMSKSRNLTMAFKASGLSKSAFYALPKDEQESLLKTAAELQRNRLLMAEPKLNDAIERAVDVLIELMDCKAPFVRLEAARTIMDRVMGPVTKKVDVTSDGEGIQFQFIGMIPDSDDDHDSAGQVQD